MRLPSGSSKSSRMPSELVRTATSNWPVFQRCTNRRLVVSGIPPDSGLQNTRRSRSSNWRDRKYAYDSNSKVKSTSPIAATAVASQMKARLRWGRADTPGGPRSRGGRADGDVALGRTSGETYCRSPGDGKGARSEEHTSELQSHSDLVCRLLLEKKKHT